MSARQPDTVQEYALQRSSPVIEPARTDFLANMCNDRHLISDGLLNLAWLDENRPWYRSSVQITLTDPCQVRFTDLYRLTDSGFHGDVTIAWGDYYIYPEGSRPINGFILNGFSWRGNEPRSSGNNDLEHTTYFHQGMDFRWDPLLARYYCTFCRSCNKAHPIAAYPILTTPPSRTYPPNDIVRQVIHV